MMAIKEYDVIYFEKLYDQYAGALYHIIVKEMGDNEVAHTIFENTCRHIFLHIHEHDPSLSLVFTWMRGIAQLQVKLYIADDAHKAGLSEP